MTDSGYCGGGGGGGGGRRRRKNATYLPLVGTKLYLIV